MDFLLEGFDAENNHIDRCIYYEATGKQLVEGEFDNDPDSSDDEWATINKTDNFAYVFNYIYNS